MNNSGNDNNYPQQALGKMDLVKIQALLSKNKLLLISTLLMAMLMFAVAVMSMTAKTNKTTDNLTAAQPKKNSPTETVNQRPSQIPVKENKIIAKVGEENIYESDYREELSSFPPANIDTKAFLLEKIASDSVILQAGAKEKLLTLDNTIFNSLSKDYKKRMAAVQTVKKAIADQAQQIEGYVVSIWFNNDGPGELGYEKGKELAEQKITQLHQKVKSGEITIQEAGEMIKKDTELSKIDTNYKGNAILKFSANPDFRITFDPDFNQVLWKLAPNEVSDIFLIKDTQRGTPKKIDSVYMFGLVQKKVVNENIDSFQNWFIKQKLLYDIKYL